MPVRDVSRTTGVSVRIQAGGRPQSLAGVRAGLRGQWQEKRDAGNAGPLAFRIAVRFSIDDFGDVTMSQGQETGVASPDEVRNLLVQCLSPLTDQETEADLWKGQFDRSGHAA